MERWERQQILGEGAIKAVTPRERANLRALERDLESSPLRGKPLRQRLRYFHLDADRYVASLGGPLPYMQRLRMIEEQTAAHLQRLEQTWLELAEECGRDSERFARRWRRRAARWDFGAVNELIEKHNRYFPAESRLPMDPRTRDFALVNGKHYSRPPLDADWVLQRFPPVLG